METKQESRLTKRTYTPILRICLLSAIGISIVLGAEMLLRQSGGAVYDYIAHSTKAFALECILVTSIIGILYYLVNNIGLATIIAGFLLITGYTIDYFKFTIKSEHVGPSDLRLVGEALNISTYFDFSISPSMIWTVLLVVWLGVMGFILKEKETSKCKRVMGGSISAFICLSCVYVIINNSAHVEIQSNLNESYDKNGLLFTFINRIDELYIKEPEEYKKSTVKNLINQVEVMDIEDITEKPNIIMIMSEAFYDVTELPNVAFSEEPIPFFKSLQEEYDGGNIVTHVFGGFTAQTEYEVLTGNSVVFTGNDSVAYTNFVYDSMPNIVSIMKKLDYSTIAIHPYKKDFYGRDKAYPKLGFDEFISEGSFENAEYIRSYISDEDVYQKIIEEYEQEKQETDNSVFMHIVTMQNHGPYSVQDSNDIEVISDKLTKDNKDSLETYTNLIKKSDEALENLIHYFEQIDEPTIIVLFGDHAPVLGENRGVYNELEANQNYTMQHTPYVIWNNYGKTFETYEDIDVSYLGSLVLHGAGIKCDKYFNYLYNHISQIKAYGNVFYINEQDDLKLISEMNESEKEIINNLWILQYDRIFGRKYIEGVE